MKYQAATQNSVDLLTWKSISMFKKEKHNTEQQAGRLQLLLLECRGGQVTQKKLGRPGHTHSQETLGKGVYTNILTVVLFHFICFSALSPLFKTSLFWEFTKSRTIASPFLMNRTAYRTHTRRPKKKKNASVKSSGRRFSAFSPQSLD